jgi:hypothetical protein
MMGRWHINVAAMGFTLSMFAQSPIPVLQPTLGDTPDLSPAQFALFEKYVKAMQLEVELTATEQAWFDSMYYAVGETRESPCQVIGMECSWYCGGGPDSIWATSSLPAQGQHRYDPANAHDLDYCTAWCEGVPGPGIGQSLTYRFKPDSPRLHTIKISNGLVTSEAAWRANNRVKRILVSENGLPVLELTLSDTMDDQTFELPRLFGQRADGQPMDLSFTILEVYPGERFDDTVITEIWFDGTDVH